jgi:hypothetical protein
VENPAATVNTADELPTSELKSGLIYSLSGSSVAESEF